MEHTSNTLGLLNSQHFMIENEEKKKKLDDGRIFRPNRNTTNFQPISVILSGSTSSVFGTSDGTQEGEEVESIY